MHACSDGLRTHQGPKWLVPLSTCTAASEPVIDWWRLMRMHKCLPAATKQIQSELEAVKPHQWQCNHTASPPGHPSWCCPRGQIRLHRCETGRDRTGRYPFPLRTPVSTLNRSHRQQAGDNQIRSRDVANASTAEKAERSPALLIRTYKGVLRFRNVSAKDFTDLKGSLICRFGMSSQADHFCQKRRPIQTATNITSLFHCAMLHPSRRCFPLAQ